MPKDQLAGLLEEWKKVTADSEHCTLCDDDHDSDEWRIHERYLNACVAMIESGDDEICLILLEDLADAIEKTMLAQDLVARYRAPRPKLARELVAPRFVANPQARRDLRKYLEDHPVPPVAIRLVQETPA